MMNPELTWEDGVPHSVRFDDKYFCKDNGYEDTMAVACGGNRLGERFARLDPARSGTFVVMETGFGAGLNFCCAWKIWEECAPVSWTLHFISLEKYPLTAAQLHRTLSRWGELNPYRDGLVEAYTPGSPGSVGESTFRGGRVRLTVVFDDVIAALQALKARGVGSAADAVFFHGFAPSKNPDMWREEVFAAMAGLCGPQTTYATFTVAGWVRRGLAAQGFSVQKEKGYGQKKHMLVGGYMGKNPFWGLMACFLVLVLPGVAAAAPEAAPPRLVMHDRPADVAGKDGATAERVELITGDDNENRARGYYFKGNTYHAEGRYEEAVAAYTQALQLAPNNGNIYGNRGHAYLKLNRLEEAMADYGKAIALDPKNGLNYGNRANLHMMRQEYQQAADDYSREIELNPDPRHSLSYNGRAGAYYFLGEYAKGLADALKARELGLPIDDNLVQALQEKAGG